LGVNSRRSAENLSFVIGHLSLVICHLSFVYLS
jgi:hypothetical protein